MVMTVNVKLNKHSGQEAYFSVTGSMCTLSGQLHDEIEAEYPGQYTDIIPLHLSDINGVPMYAVENGYYFLEVARGSKPGKYTFYNVAKHLRISVEQAIELRSYSKEGFKQFVEDQKPRWKAEAEAAIIKHKLL